MEDEDQTTASKSQASRSKNGKKRKITVLDSDDSDDSSESDEDARPPKKPRRKNDGLPTTAQSPAREMSPAVKTPRYTWENLCGDMKESIEHAKAAGLKERGAEFIRLVSMGKEKGVKYYNANRERFDWMRKDAKKQFASIPAAGSSETTPKQPTLKNKAGKAAKKTVPPATPKSRKAKTLQGSAESMPPPKNTRSATRQLLSRQSVPEDDELDPPFDTEEDPAPRTKNTSAR